MLEVHQELIEIPYQPTRSVGRPSWTAKEYLAAAQLDMQAYVSRRTSQASRLTSQASLGEGRVRVRLTSEAPSLRVPPNLLDTQVRDQ